MEGLSKQLGYRTRICDIKFDCQQTIHAAYEMTPILKVMEVYHPPNSVDFTLRLLWAGLL